MAINAYGSGLDAAAAMMRQGGDMMMGAVRDASSGNLEDAALGMILAKTTTAAGAVLARMTDETMQSTLDMLA